MAELLVAVEVVETEGNLDVEVSGITDDSRAVEPGGVFVAVKGQRTDGHGFVDEACRRGAAGVVVQVGEEKEGKGKGRMDSRFTMSGMTEGRGPAWVTVRDSRKALGRLAARFFEQPSESLAMVGVTGTNGKTTVAHVCRALLESAGCRTGIIGTVGYAFGDVTAAATHTTPGAVALQSLLRRMVSAGMAAAVVEVSSHALEMDRVEGCAFDVAVFTNLTRDHLDFHGDMESYYRAKARLFGVGARDAGARLTRAAARRPARAIVNIDDEWGARLAAETAAPVWTCALRRRADLEARDVALSPEGTRFTARTPAGEAEIRTALVGEHNVSNLLAGIGVGLARGLSLEVMREGIRNFRAVPGRFERVDAGQAFAVIVDYAHTEDALARLLAAARELRTGRLLTVVGCGGDRDRGKRAPMGRVAAQHSDAVFLTSDNPRTEDPGAILREVEQGALEVAESERGACVVIPDRRAAIQAALREARAGDMVLIAGKGHEDYQIIGRTRHHFDDREVARELLAALRKG